MILHKKTLIFTIMLGAFTPSRVATLVRQRAVVFDMAGTLINDHSLVYSALSKTLGGQDMTEFRGLAKKEVIASCCAPAIQEAKLIEFEDTLASMYEAQPPQLMHHSIRRQLTTYQDNGIMVGLTTGFSSKQQEELISRLSLHPHIDGYIASDEVERGRPYPDMLQELMSQFGVLSGSDIIKVGDTPIDIVEGRSVGATTVGVTSGGTPEEDLWKAGADYVYSDVTKLPLSLILGDHSNF